jgi:hypothetical protein
LIWGGAGDSPAAVGDPPTALSHLLIKTRHSFAFCPEPMQDGAGADLKTAFFAVNSFS